MPNTLFQYYFILLLTLFILGSSTAQNNKLLIQELGLEDGLSSYNIEYFFQDSKGFVWIGTDYGLNRYDGAEIKVYTKEENGLCGNFTSFISEDPKGNLWIFAKGINNDFCTSVFDSNKEQFYTLEEYLGEPPPFVEAHTVSYPIYKGSCTFREFTPSTEEVTYYEYDGKKIRKILHPHYLDYSKLDFILGEVYKTGENRYSHFLKSISQRHKSKIIFTDSTGFVLDSILCPYEAPFLLNSGVHSGSFCVICLSAINDVWNYILLEDSLPAQEKVIPVKSFNNVPIISWDKNKVYTLSSDSFKIYNRLGYLEQALPSGIKLENAPTSFLTDNNHNIWFGCNQKLYYLSVYNSPFKTELYAPDTYTKIRGIALDQDKTIYTGGVAFLNQKKDNSTWGNLSINTQSSHYQNYLGMLIQDQELWLGTENSRVIHYPFKTKKYSEFPLAINQKGTVASLVWMLYQAKDGTIWAGTTKGLYYLDTTQGQFLPLDPFNTTALSQSTVYAFHQNAAGTWLSSSLGLFLVDLTSKKVLAHYNSAQKDSAFIPTSHIAHLHEDQAGVFWLATKGNGLIRWNPKTKAYKQYTKKGAGLSHNVLYSVYEDDFGYLWISSQRGLMRFNKDSEFVKIYLEENGLPHNEFNTIAHYKAESGHLYFGGQNGFIHFHPKDFQEKLNPSPFVITSFFKQNRQTDSLENLTTALLNKPIITLTPDDKSFILNFALLDYTNSKNHQYSYQIIGHDKEWSYLSDNQIKINNLPYGNYQLKLRAKAANDSQWINYSSIIAIRVLRPFYLEWWFIAPCILFFLGLIYGIMQWRLQKLSRLKNKLEKIVATRTAKVEQQAEELKALDKVKSNFFANISHELRTPLTLILGPLSYILDNPNDWKKEEVQQQLLTMQRNGKSLLQLVEEILDLSKLEANKLDLEEEGTPAQSFFERIFALFIPSFESKNIDYQFIYTLSEENLNLLLDRKKVEKVLNNFLSNAIKFTPKSGKITLNISETNSSICIKVSDTGKGIHPKDLPHIFERFYQSKLADQKLYGGTGIGLALVSDFATLMKGKAYVESTLNIGSHFYFEFPKKVILDAQIILQPTIDDYEDDLISSIGSNFTILVVEDNLDMRNFVCQLLQKHYHKILAAQNGAEGLEMLQKYGTDIHLIVSDVMMPEIDGLSMLKTIKANPQWNGIPTIMLTALAAERDKLTALTIGVDDYLTKPFSVPELVIRTQNLLFNYHQRLEWKKNLAVLGEDDAENQEAQLSLADKNWISNIEEMVKDSIKTKVLDVETLANFAFLSPKQLTRKIKAITGLTPARFIKEVQLQLARKELEGGTVISVTDVAFNCGFEQASTFSTVFKKRFGKSPSDYLKVHLGNS